MIDTTQEKLIEDFLLNTGQATHESFKIVNLSMAGEWVMFEECSVCESYTKQHMIPILDIVAWIYVKMFP